MQGPGRRSNVPEVTFWGVAVCAAEDAGAKYNKDNHLKHYGTFAAIA